MYARENGLEKVILPVWHKVTASDIVGFSPILADKVAISTDRGLKSVASSILEAVKTNEREANKEANNMLEDIFVIGIDVGTAYIDRGVVRFPSDHAQPPEIVEPLARIKWHGKNEADLLVDKIFEAIEDTSKNSFIRPNKITQIGIGLPGQVDPINGILLRAPALDLTNLDIANMVKQRLTDTGHWPESIKVLIDNDVTCMTIAEKVKGEGKSGRVTNFVCVAIGKGIGSGLVVDGNLYRGFNFNAGEVGHMTIDLSENARPCVCGSRGCFEEYCAERGVIKTTLKYIADAKMENPKSVLANLNDDITTLRAENISEIISLPDASVTKLREELARHFAIGLANIANLINPQVIVITGGIGLGFFQYTAFQNAVNRHIKTYVLDACRTTLVQSRMKKEAQVIGAAMLGSNTVRL